MRHILLAAIAALVINLGHAQEHDEVEHPTVATAAIPTEAKKLPNSFNQRQQELLLLAEQIAKEDNLKHPELLQGILLQETRAGIDPTYKTAKNNCFGILQIKIAAAIHVLREFPELITKYKINIRDARSLTQKLIHDDEFNLRIGSKYVLIMERSGYSTIKQIALAYNQGAGGAKRKNAETFHYSISVVKHIRSLK